VTLRQGPGLAKARALGLYEARRAPRIRVTDAQWRGLFDGADMVSEGSVKNESGGSVWYGSTSLILKLPESASAAERALLAAVAARDLHARLRAVRLAHREAQLRAPARLGRSSCEIRVGLEARGVRIDVDVQAPLIGGLHLGSADR
jgi:hypothetical protein